MATKEGNRIAAQKLHDGKALTQDEARGLATARGTAGSESKKLDRIVEGKDK